IQAQYAPGTGTSGTSGALSRGRFTDAADMQRRQPGPGRIACRPSQTTINHGRHALNGDRALGDVGGKNQPALLAERNCPVLLPGREIPMQGQHHQACLACDSFTVAQGAVNLRSSGQKDQYVSSMVLPDEHLDCAFYLCVKRLRRIWKMFDGEIERPAL